MSNDNDDQKQKKGVGLLGLAVAMTIGAALGLLFAPQKGEKTQEELIERAHEIAKKFKKSREEVQNTVQDIFGEVTEELEKIYVRIRAEILAMMDEMKKNANLTKENYDKLVDETVKEFSKGKDWSEKTINKLTKTLKNEWEEFKK